MKILIEFDPRLLHESGSNPDELLKILANHNFKFYVVDSTTEQFELVDLEHITQNFLVKNVPTNLLCIRK